MESNFVFNSIHDLNQLGSIIILNRGFSKVESMEWRLGPSSGHYPQENLLAHFQLVFGIYIC